MYKIFIVQKNPDYENIVFIKTLEELNNSLLFKRLKEEDYTELLNTKKYNSDDLIIWADLVTIEDLNKLKNE